MKMTAIRQIAKAHEIKSFGKKKVDLVREIQAREGNFACFATARDFCDQKDCCFKADCFTEAKKLSV